MEPKNALAKMLADSVGRENLEPKVIALFETGIPVEKVVIPPKIVSELWNDLFSKCGREIQGYRRWAAESLAWASQSPVK